MIAVDLDSTLNKLLDSWLEWINKNYNKNIQLSDIRKWDDIEVVPNIGKEIYRFFTEENYRLVPPIEGAKEFLEELQKLDEVVIITASPKAHEKFKKEYIKKHFGDYKLICDSTKQNHLGTGDILIDDGFHNIYPTIIEKDVVGILFNDNNTLLYAYHTMQHKNFYRAKDYKEVLQTVKAHYR